MTEVDRAIGPEPTVARLSKAGLSESSLVNTDLGASSLGEPALDVGPADVLVALATSALSLAVLVYGMSAIASAPVFIASHLAVLTVPVLLLVATFAAGPVGALGCAIMALMLWRQNPSPTRLQEWYDYIAGVVARTRLTRIYDELASGRLPSDPAAKVPRFGPILERASVEDQQRVLGVIGRRYHAEFRPVLRKALRSSNGFIRAQAAAVASGLDVDEKNRLWSTGNEPTARDATTRTTLDVEPRRTGPHSDQLRS